MLRNRFRFIAKSLQEKLWIKPLGNAILATAAVLVAHLADGLPLEDIVPDVSTETVEKLLTVISASMLGVATFAVASMVSAYASAGGSATPRAFALIIADGLSQTALSTFIGAFIFSIVGIIAIKVGYFAVAGRFLLFLFTIAIFAWVVITFVRWVDNIARLGQLGNTVEKVDAATREAFGHWDPRAPLGARPAGVIPKGVHLRTTELGYIQHIDTGRMEAWAKKNEAMVYIRSLPGAFIDPRRILLTVEQTVSQSLPDMSELLSAFVIAERRSYPVDPRFGLIALSEIGSRALSPGINDPGTAIDVALRMARIIIDWCSSSVGATGAEPELQRVFVTPLNPRDLVEDAFGAICKDGVGSVEVGVWIQKSLALLAQANDPAINEAAHEFSNLAMARAEQELTFPHDLERVRNAHQLVSSLRKTPNSASQKILAD